MSEAKSKTVKSSKAFVLAAVKEGKKLLKDNPQLTHAQVAKQVGIAQGTLSRHLKKKKKLAKEEEASGQGDTASELTRLVSDLEKSKKALRDYLEAYLSL